MSKDKDVIDLEEVNGVYEPVSTHVEKQPKQKRNIKYKVQQNNVYTTNVYEQPQSDLEQLIGGFNEGMRLINRFIKLIR
jgi:pantothenate kinase